MIDRISRELSLAEGMLLLSACRCYQLIDVVRRSLLVTLLIATNQSCLLARTLLRFAGFHKRPSFGILRGLLYLEACKSRIASGI